MELIDTHAHLYVHQFEEDRKEMVLRAVNSGIASIFLPNIDSGSIQDMFDLESEFPGVCFPMMGLHPCSVKENFREELEKVEAWLDKRSFSGVGEMGLDLYWDKSFFEEQKEAFLYQCKLAVDHDLPIIIHSRLATAECLDLIKSLPSTRRPTGVFHCFGGTMEEAKEAIDLGFFLGIGGVLTFKKSGLDLIVKELGLNSLVLETDSPYLAPVPHRGKRNESFYIHQIAAALASTLQTEIEEVAGITTRNAKKLFEKTFKTGFPESNAYSARG
ncbi:MAG: TatD family hydrolase [Saprospiraceae bacterium]|nr:TatD family hydrolase [Saprospiraceae bacterium]